MRKIRNILWNLAFATIPMFILFSGCGKFLDRKPLGTAQLSEITQGGVDGLAFGLYAAMRNPDVAGQGFGGIPWFAVNGFRADDAIKGSSQADGADWEDIFDKYNYVKDHWSANTYWEQHYLFIGLANTLLQNADSLHLTDVGSTRNIAEARWFRAFAYFDLVRTYGQVPKIDFRVYRASEANIAKSSINDIYALIDADLQFAEANLPESWGSVYPGRLNRYTAMTLHAKALLYRQRWSEALALCKQIINSGKYSLYPEYAKYFTEAGELSSESIFEVQNGKTNAQLNTIWSWFAVAQGVRGSGAWDLGWGWNAPSQSLVDAYEAGDPRKNATILFSGQPDGIYGKLLPPYPSSLPRPYWNKKVYPDPAFQASTGYQQAYWFNQRVLRYADVILMAAEAANEVGGAANATLAETYLEMIRARARGGNTALLPFVAFVSQGQMRAAIQNERRIEMALEGERFFDLVRWGLAPSVLGPLGYQARNKYYPLPQPAVDNSNGVLIQNPDYP